MPLSRIASNGTFNLKATSGGYVRAISCPNAGTSWTLQINDGPDQTGTVVAIYGATPGTVTTSIGLLSPLYFSKGLQVVTSGTAGELDIDWV